jgi:hypothetical protein
VPYPVFRFVFYSEVVKSRLLKRKNDNMHVIDNQKIDVFFQKDNVKGKFQKEICPHLKSGNKMKNTKIELYQVVEAISRRFKTGCQCRQTCSGALLYSTLTNGFWAINIKPCLNPLY